MEYASGNVPFDAGQLTAESIILKQFSSTSLAANTMSVEFFFDGKIRIYIPLQYLTIWDYSGVQESKSPVVAESLRSLWDPTLDFMVVRFFDVASLWTTISLLLSLYLEWLKYELSDSWTVGNGFRVGLRLTNVWGNVPFLDVDEWGEHVKAFGLPMMQRDSARVPRNESGRIILSPEEDVPLWMVLGTAVWWEFGLTADLIDAATRFLASQPPRQTMS